METSKLTSSFMKCFLLLASIALSFTVSASETTTKAVLKVKVPMMKRAGMHRTYADALLDLALHLSSQKYGPYEIEQQKMQSVIRRQLQDLQQERISVAVSMPMPDWMETAQVVQFPLMKGLASYRMFLMLKQNKTSINQIASLDSLRTLAIGQGQGWSTQKILVDNGFHVVEGVTYQTLFSMLEANRFQLLMRSVYEVGPELEVHRAQNPNLDIADNLAVFTYLPMYFFVSKSQPLLVERLQYGLELAHASGKLDEMYNYFFSSALKLLNKKQRKIFYLTNSNIDASYFEQDKPYLLEVIQHLGNAQ